MKTVLLASLLSFASLSAAQESTPSADAPSTPPTEGRLSVRFAGGLAHLSLGEAGAFHQSVADTYVSSGVPVPTQRAYPAGVSGGVDVLWSTGTPSPESTSQFGVGVRYAGTSAYSLYGDYAGTLDIVSRVSAVFVETVSVVEFRPGQSIRPFIGSRGGTVLASTLTEETIDLGELGTSESSIAGRGVGYSVEVFWGVSSTTGPVGLSVQGGYRYARVPKLDGEASSNGETVEEGRLPYGLTLSGWSVSAGITLRASL